MFTGIIQDIGQIEEIDKRGDWTLSIKSNLDSKAIALGSSIAHDGICLTVIEKTDIGFVVRLSSETIQKTTAKNWRVRQNLNLERSLRLGDEMAGHMVLGHVDGVGEILSIEKEQDSLRYCFKLSEAFAPYLAPKGSIALDGISLTINESKGSVFGVNIIPHTQEKTALKEKRVGDLVNFEVDPIARYVVHGLRERKA